MNIDEINMSETSTLDLIAWLSRYDAEMTHLVVVYNRIIEEILRRYPDLEGNVNLLPKKIVEGEDYGSKSPKI